MTAVIRYGIGMFIGLLACVSIADELPETIVIGTFPIPLMVESEEKGIFIELTQALAKEAGLNIQIRVFPAQRTLREFAAKRLDGLFPGLAVTMPVPYERTTSVYVKRDYAFTRKGEKPLHTVEQLAGKKVALTSGYPYVEPLTSRQDIRFELANSDEQNVKKLLAGRVDAFVVELKSGLKAFHADGREGAIHYDIAKPLSEQDVFYALQTGEHGEQLAQRLSQALERLKRSGRFDQIMAVTR